jgi:hypothetical protein
MKKIRTKIMQPRRALPVILCLATMAGCDVGNIIDNGDASGNAKSSESFSFELQVVGQKRLELRGLNGNVELVGVPEAATVQIWGERSVTSKSTADAQDYLSNLQVRVVDGNDAVLVETVQPDDNRGRGLQVDYHLRVPYSWQAALHNANGNIVVDSLGQAVTVVLTNGNVIAQAITGNVSAGLTNGNVVLQDVSGSVDVGLTNGNVSARVIMPARAACNVNTVNGIIDLQIPRTTSAEFSASLANGTISLSDLTLQNASSSPTWVRGKLGEGSGKISLKTVNGDIHVRGF